MDGHGSVTALAETNETGTVVTDTYTYDAYGTLLKKTGTTDNDYLYTGEQYNEATGIYYLRARYMNPETGTFISMDSYAGSLDNPVSLHKYLYANANPVMYTDPTGYFSLAESSVVQGMKSVLNTGMQSLGNLRKVMSWANMAVTLYDIHEQIQLLQSGEGSILGLVLAIAGGIVTQAFLNCTLTKLLGNAANTVLKVIGVAQDAGSFLKAVKSGDPEKIVVETVRLIVSIFTLKCQCFTGETLVSTTEGDKQIDEIEVGDYVYAYDTETGENIAAKVTYVSITETDILVHVYTSEGEEIKTTMLHPFYVKNAKSGDEEHGVWKAASNLVKGDELLTEDGRIVYVEEIRIERLTESIQVYNLEVEGLHTYYVGSGVLIHNACGDSQKLRNKMNAEGIFQPNDGNSYAAHHIVASSSPHAEASRVIFEILDIDINDYRNGVFLPQGNFGIGANHNGLHTKMYFLKVNLLIKKAFNMDGDKRENVLNMLKFIGELLLKDEL